MSFLGLLNLTCAIQRATLSQGSTGEMSKSWDTVEGMEEVPCRIVEQGPPSAILAHGNVETTRFKVYLPATTDVLVSDRIAQGDDTYTVVGIPMDSSLDHFEVIAEIITLT